jgi:uncharacterized integral membrane protein
MDNKENIETAGTGKTEERKSSVVWKCQVVIFIILPIILTVLIPLRGLPYLCGRLNYHLTLICLFFYPIVFGFIIYCFFVGTVRLFRDWKKVRKHGKLLNFAQFCIPILFVVLFVKPLIIPIESVLLSPAEVYNYGLRDRIKSKADIKAIRDWLETLDKEDYDESGVRLPRDEWPKSLRVLNPPHIDLYADSNGNPKVRIIWGGGVFHWGVEIGMEDMENPPFYFGPLDEWLLMESGVYIWNW